MEPLHPDVKKALKNAYQDLADDYIERYEELLQARFLIDPDENPQEIARLDREREQLIEQFMPQFQEINQRFSQNVAQESSQIVGESAVRTRLEAFGQRLTQTRNRRYGAILLHLTGEEAGDWCLDYSGEAISVLQGKGDAAPVVEVTGNAKRIVAILEGRKEARKAFVAGGIRVRGDIPYLEAIGREMGFIRDE